MNHNTHSEDKKDLGLRIMVFSGTDDSVCATQGTSLWISRQPWAVMDNQEWTAWYVFLGVEDLGWGWLVVRSAWVPSPPWLTDGLAHVVHPHTNKHSTTLHRGLGQQVAGYIQGFTNGFTYATVHGAGHEVRRSASARGIGFVL